MAGKITVQGFQQAVLGSKVDIFIDGVAVGSVSKNEKQDISIDKNCKMTFKEKAAAWSVITTYPRSGRKSAPFFICSQEYTFTNTENPLVFFVRKI